ncbi:hypothetical protein N9C97_00210 [Candidatus Pelagibacter sp.]|nr:hypothetical protein [Candidatus Pelagibacter sp.]
MIKITLIIASIIFILLTWITSNVCKFNYILDKKSKIMSELNEEMGVSLGNTKVYYFKELNCKKADLNYDFSRMVNNLEVISVMVYQYLTTDILGRPLNID